MVQPTIAILQSKLVPLHDLPSLVATVLTTLVSLITHCYAHRDFLPLLSANMDAEFSSEKYTVSEANVCTSKRKTQVCQVTIIHCGGTRNEEVFGSFSGPVACIYFLPHLSFSNKKNQGGVKKSKFLCI